MWRHAGFISSLEPHELTCCSSPTGPSGGMSCYLLAVWSSLFMRFPFANFAHNSLLALNGNGLEYDFNMDVQPNERCASTSLRVREPFYWTMTWLSFPAPFATAKGLPSATEVPPIVWNSSASGTLELAISIRQLEYPSIKRNNDSMSEHG